MLLNRRKMKKICPNPDCLTVNSAKSATCQKCGWDLDSVIAIPADKVEEELKRLQSAREPEAQSPSVAQAQLSNEQVRLCPNLDCNHINSVSKRLCEKCRTPITNIITRQEAEAEILRRSQEVREAPTPQPAPKKPEASKPKPKRKATCARIVSDDGSYSYDIKPGKITVGRQSEMREHLQPMTWVSRKHAELNFENGILTVQDLDSPNHNHTYVNGKKVRSGEVRELADGDVLGLGDSRKDTPGSQAAFFRVELR